jgi:hypothetical protein
MWCAVSTRPDLGFAAGYLSRFNSNPTVEHLKAAKRVLTYLKGTLALGLVFGMKTHNDNRLVGYSDSDYASDLDSRRSTTGFVFRYKGSILSWGSARQATVALSTCEAEYMALAEAYKEGIWTWRLLRELGQKTEPDFLIYCDKRGAVALAANPGHHKRTKHIDIRYRAVEAVEAGRLTVQPINTRYQLVDALTKALKGPLPSHHLELLQLQ